MKLREKLEKIKPLEETTRDVKRLIEGNRMSVTGSYCFEVETEDSDIDIMINPHGMLKLHFSDVINNHNGIYLSSPDGDYHYFTDDFQSCYVLSDNKIYNLLFFHDTEKYKKWRFATDCVSYLLGSFIGIKIKNHIRNKPARVELFEYFKNLYEKSEGRL